MTDDETFNLGRLNMARMYDNCSLVDESPDFKVPEWVDAHAKLMERVQTEVSGRMGIPASVIRKWLETPAETFLMPPNPTPTGDGMLALALALMAARTSRRRDYLSSLDTRPRWAHDNEPWYQTEVG